jgi:hypothetical protein
MKVRLLLPAFDDLAAGRRFYGKSRGVGDYFYDCLFEDIDSLALNAGIHPLQYGFHRLLAKRFPHAIYYKVIDGEAVVFRVLDCRRDPSRIKRALK